MNNYFLLKGFKRIEVNYFAPFFGYNNLSDGLNVNKRNEYEQFVSKTSLEAEERLKLFYQSFKEDFHQANNYISFTLYEPKIYKDILLSSANKMFDNMNERIEEKEQEGVLTIYLIDQNLSNVLKFQDNLPFVNYIIFNV